MYAKKNSGKKRFILLIAVMLVVGCTVGSTLAWLITKTDPVVNTFTAGNINITLTEPQYERYVKDSQGRSKLIPGGTIPKDPTVTVLKGSEPCYVRMYVVFRWEEEADGWFKGTDAQNWFDFDSSWSLKESYIDEVSNVTKVNIYEFRYNSEVTVGLDEDTALPALFTEINLPDYLTGDKYTSLDNSKVEILAQAVQAEGFDDADAAFAAAGRPAYVTELINKYYPDPETP